MKTVGETLKSVREKQGLSLEEIVAQTHIKHEYLNALESGDFGLLPSPIAVQGFINTYAQVLGIEPKTALALLRRDYAVTRASVLPKQLFASQQKRKKLIVGNRWYELGVTVACVAAVLLYGLVTYASLHNAPRLVLTAPKDGANTSQNVVVRGATASDATLEIDTQPVALTQDGEFARELVLPPGDHVITVIARNRQKKETIKQLQVHVTMTP